MSSRGPAILVWLSLLGATTTAVLISPGVRLSATSRSCCCPACAAAAFDAAILRTGNVSGIAYDSSADTDEQLTGGSAGSAAAESSAASALVVRALQWYKRTISPLLPPGCRFIPTCSEYAIDSFKAFPVWQAAILTAWRLVRCNPTAGFGLDVPQWPPPGYWAGSKQVRTPLDDEKSRRKAVARVGDPLEISSGTTAGTFGDPLGVRETAVESHADGDGVLDGSDQSVATKE